MWYILENVQQSHDLSDRLIRAICNWQIGDGDDDVEELLDQGADVNRLHGTLLPLHCACMACDADSAALLLQRGAMINAIDGYGRSALFYASERDASCSQLLIDHGADLNATDASGDTPLHYAAYKNNVPAMVILLDSGASANALDLNRETPISWAAKRGNLQSVKVLLQYNAVPDARDLNGRCPLVHAAQIAAAGLGANNDYDAVVELLLKSMGQFDLRDDDGQLPNQIASDNRLTEMLVPYCCNARPLRELCRRVVRSCLGQTFLPDVVPKLPVPAVVQEYLQLQRS